MSNFLLCVIYNTIDFLLGTQLPDLPCYRMSPSGLLELLRKIRELMDKGYLWPSKSPCAMPALLAPTKDGSWCCVLTVMPLTRLSSNIGFLFDDSMTS